MGLQNPTPINLLISNNIISNNNWTGIINSGNSRIQYNTVTDNSSSNHSVVHGICIAGGIYNTGSSTISNNTLTNNSFSNCSPYSSSAGAIYNTGNSTISNNTLTGNSCYQLNGASFAGGIYNSGNSAISNNTLTGNSCWSDNAGLSAGGIYNSGDSTISNNTLTDNSSYSDHSGINASFVGGIYNTGSATINNNTLTDNSSYGDNNASDNSFTGGIYNTGDSTISNNIVTNNSASIHNGLFPSFVGGICNKGSSTIINNTVANNSTTGIYSKFNPSIITGNIVIGNSGGGIVSHASTITSNEIKNNSSNGILNTGASMISNNIIKSNLGAAISNDGNSVMQYNLIKNNGCPGLFNGPAISNNGYSIIENNDIICNSNIYGIYTLTPLSSFTGNNLLNYSNYEFYYGAATDQLAANNYWGTTVDIDNRIYDYWDNITLGKVLYQPFAPIPFNISGEPQICCVKFNDVPTAYWAEDYIEQIACHNITTGCGGGNYCPSNNVTRQAMAAFIIRAVEGEPPDDYCSSGSPFTDVPTTSQFCKYIKRLYELGITTGCTATEYCPFNPVNRQAMAAFIIRAVEGEPPDDYCSSGSPVTDVPTTSQFCKYIKRSYELGITTGCTATEYCPFNNVTRAAMAAFLTRAFLQAGELSLSLNPTVLPDAWCSSVYNHSVIMTASGGMPPYVYSCYGSGNAGLTTSSSGNVCSVSGSPSISPSDFIYTVIFNVTDSANNTASSSIVVNIINPW